MVFYCQESDSVISNKFCLLFTAWAGKAGSGGKFKSSTETKIHPEFELSGEIPAPDRARGGQRRCQNNANE